MGDEKVGKSPWDFTDKLDDFRELFKTKYKDAIEEKAYDEVDLERLYTKIHYAHSYLMSANGNFEDAADKVDVSFRFRKEYGVNGLTEESFAAVYHETGTVFYSGKDKEGDMIINFRLKQMKKAPKDWKLRKQMICYWLDKHFVHRLNSGDRCLVLIDMAGIGITDIDLDSMKFMMDCFTKWYPSFSKMLILYEMPWLVTGLWKAIKLMLSEEQREYVKLLGKKEVGEYIDQENLFPHMGGKNEFEYKYEPNGTCGNPWDTPRRIGSHLTE